MCSALYELGGMTVMHDPSGCNSTYNTHDEIRWYDQDSLIYISGLTEIDAIMGNDEKFLDDIKEAARELHPKFIALAGVPNSVYEWNRIFGTGTGTGRKKPGFLHLQYRRTECMIMCMGQELH